MIEKPNQSLNGADRSSNMPMRHQDVMTLHEQVEIDWDGEAIDVDIELAPLVGAILRRGMATLLSCQEITPGVAWIKFASTRDAKAFLWLSGVFPAELVNALPETKEECAALAEGQPDRPWGYRVHPKGSVSLRIPRDQIELLVERIEPSI